MDTRRPSPPPVISERQKGKLVYMKNIEVVEQMSDTKMAVMNALESEAQKKKINPQAIEALSYALKVLFESPSMNLML
jgi:hypothetical protein